MQLLIINNIFIINTHKPVVVLNIFSTGTIIGVFNKW